MPGVNLMLTFISCSFFNLNPVCAFFFFFFFLLFFRETILAKG